MLGLSIDKSYGIDLGWAKASIGGKPTGKTTGAMFKQLRTQGTGSETKHSSEHLEIVGDRESHTLIVAVMG
jgi:hypothetical protein